ncbi:famh-161, partial [Pristionchus pacificus]
ARTRLEERRSREERMEDDYRPRRDRRDEEGRDSSEERKKQRRPVTITAEREKARRWRSASDLREVRKKEEEARRERCKQNWIPAVTEPRPFTMSTREPIRARYSQQFVDKLVEKRRKEEEERKGDEEKQMKYKFHAVPVPESTYTPTNPRVLREEYVKAVRARTQQRLARWKSKSSDELWVPKSRPVPLSTYIPPKSYAMSRSKSAHERALRLLTEASTPPGLKEHEARTHVRTALRHRPCTGDYSHHPVPTSIPNFKELHRRFEEKMGDAQYKPPTVPVPFNFTHGTGKKTHEKCIEEEIAEKRADARPITKHSPSPVRKTQASEMRERAIREKLELRTSEVVRTEERKREERDRFLRNAHRLKALVGERKSVEDEIRVKAEQKRRELVERQRDYEKSLREMKDRVEDRPLVVERQGIISSQQALQKRFDQVMKNADTAISQPVTIEKRERKEGDREESEESGGTFDVKREELKEGKDYKDDFEADSSSSSMKTSSSSTSSSSSKKKTSPTSSKQIGLSNDNDDSSSSSVSSPSSSGHSSPKRSPSKLSNITERTETSEH